jgi:hypothetical protein
VTGNGELLLLTQAQYASARGWVKSYATKLKAKGLLVMVGNLVDVAASDARIALYRDPARGGDRSVPPSAGSNVAAALPASVDPAAPRSSLVAPAPDVAAGAGSDGTAGAGMSYQEAARRERMAKARLAELELAEAAGDLLRKDVVQRVWFSLARQAQQKLRTVKYRLSNQLATESDPQRIAAMLDAELVQVINELVAADPCNDELEGDEV